MDFWAQHKDFVLKVLAGFAVFLVALIARGITFGDELQMERGKNARLSGEIRRLAIAPRDQQRRVEKDTEQLVANTRTMAEQIGWDLGDDALELKLLRRILAYTRDVSDVEAVQKAAEAREALLQDVDGGFGQLRLFVRQRLAEEASEKNIPFLAGVGYDEVTEVKDDEVVKHLLQLELAARMARYAIDVGVDAVTDFRISTKQQRRQPIPGANPEFLEEYPVRMTFRCTQKAFSELASRLGASAPRAPLKELEVRRLRRPANHLEVELTVMAVAANPEVPFEVEKG